MDFFRWIKCKRMKRKASNAEIEATIADYSVRVALEKVAIEDAKREELIRELDKIPWYRFIKRRSTWCRLKKSEYKVYRAKKVATKEYVKYHHAHMTTINMNNLVEAEKISEKLSDTPDDVGVINSWLSNPPICYAPSLLIDKRQRIPKTKGIYAWYFAHNSLKVPSDSYFKVDDFELVYIGIAGKKPESKGHLRSRIFNQHITGNAEGSALRLNLGILLRRQGFSIELIRKGIKEVEWSDEDSLTEWICKNAIVAWIEHKHPWLVEEQILKSFGLLLPLNYKNNENNKFAQDLKHERDFILLPFIKAN